MPNKARLALAVACAVSLWVDGARVGALAQFAVEGWPDAAVPSVPEAEPPVAPPEGATVVERSPDAGLGELRLVALLTVDGQQIDQGLVWRVYPAGTEGEPPKAIETRRDASPVVNLKPGDYLISAAFGKAYLTRKIAVAAGQSTVEQFVLNAGGLKVSATVEGAEGAGPVVVGVYSDEKDQFDNRAVVLPNARPDVVYRLNAGIYQVVSRYGDANAVVDSDITVEAGKLTEVAVKHTGAATTFKLVARPGGEALPDTQWTIQNAAGEIVKEAVGALPTHILAPGEYKVSAKSGGRSFGRAFSVTGGGALQVEVVMRQAANDPPLAPAP